MRLLFGVVLVLLAALSLAPRRTLCKNCNIIVLSLDTVGANHLPCYGYARNTAPNLCAFADKNVRFQHAYSNASWTLPSDVSMLTSLYPSFHGMMDYADYERRLSSEIPKLPELLKDNGYTTYFGIPPNDRAFPSDVYSRGIDHVIHIRPGQEEERDLAAALETFRASAASGEKTFLFLHSYAAHGPYLTENRQKMFTDEAIPTVPLRWDDVYGNFSEDFYRYLLDELGNVVGKPQATIDRDFYEQLKNAPTLAAAQTLARSRLAELESYYTEYYYFAKINLSDPRQVEYIKALYDQKIYELDSWVGRVFLPLLEDPELKDNTMVLITSEHGEEFLEHGRITHETLYDTNVKVPFILSLPGATPLVSDVPVQGVDVTPMILDMVGVSRERQRFQGGQMSQNRLLVAESQTAKTVRTKQWKLFLTRSQNEWIPYELYDIQTDPMEQDNVLLKHFDVAKTLLRQHERYENVWQWRLRLGP